MTLFQVQPYEPLKVTWLEFILLTKVQNHTVYIFMEFIKLKWMEFLKVLGLEVNLLKNYMQNLLVYIYIIATFIQSKNILRMDFMVRI